MRTARKMSLLAACLLALSLSPVLAFADEVEGGQATEPAVASVTAGSAADNAAKAADDKAEKKGSIVVVPNTQASSLNPSDDISTGLATIASSINPTAVLDVPGASTTAGAKIQLYANNSTPAQRWRLESVGNGFFKIVNIGSNKVLSVTGNKARNEARIEQASYTGAAGQKWKFSKTTGGYLVASALSDRYVLDAQGGSAANGTRVQLYAANGTPAQTWKISSISPVIDEGVYTLKAACSGKVLDIAGGRVEKGANAHQYTANNTVAQNFQLRYDKKTGYYTIVAVASGQVLDVAGGSTKNGGNVQLYSNNGTLAQKWAILANADGNYTILSAKSGRALDVAGASKRNGANVWIYAANNTPAQRWQFSKVLNWLPDGVYSFVYSKSASRALGVAESSRSAKANVELARRWDASWEQSWAVVQQGTSGYYLIRNMNSRHALDVSGNAARNGANICQDAVDRGDGQLFKPEIALGGVVWRSKLNENIVIDLSGGGTAVGTNAQLYTSNGTGAQKFRMKEISTKSLLSNNTFNLRNLAANKMVDVAGASTANNAKIHLYKSNGTPAQKFRFVHEGSGRFALLNTNSGKAVAASGSTVVQNGTGSSAAQRWTPSLDLASVTFYLTNVSSGKRLDGRSGTLSLKEAAAGTAQQFALTPTSGDYFRVYLNSGHGWNSNNNGVYDPGAQAYGIREADLCSELSDLVIKYARELYGLDVIDGRPYELAYWRRLPKAIELKCTTIFSIHFDIDSGVGSGPMGMVGVSGRHSASLEFNDIMLRHLAASLPDLPNRGTYYRNDITCVNGDIPACLVEVCFVDNPRDTAYYQTRKDTVARELAAGLYEASLRPSLRKAG